MSVITFNVRRIEEQYGNNVVAKIFAFKRGRSIAFQVSSSNELFENHLKSILDAPFHAVLPGPKSQGYTANHAEYFIPNSISYFTFLHDRLGWYGYVTDIMNKSAIIKNLLLHEESLLPNLKNNIFIYNSKTKSLSDSQYYRQNAQGETILIEVPPGKIAVSKQGKVVKPGRKLAFNGVKINTPDARWSVITDDQAKNLGYDTEGVLEQKELPEGAEDIGTDKDIYLIKTNIAELDDAELAKKISKFKGTLHWFKSRKKSNSKAKFVQPIDFGILALASGAEDVADIKTYLQNFGFTDKDIAEMFDTYLENEQPISLSVPALSSSGKEVQLLDRLADPGNFILVSKEGQTIKNEKGQERIVIAYPTDLPAYEAANLEWDIYEIPEEYKKLSYEELQSTANVAVNKGKKIHPYLLLGELHKPGTVAEAKQNSKTWPVGHRKYLDSSKILPADLDAIFRDSILGIKAPGLFATPEGANIMGSEEFAGQMADFLAVRQTLMRARNQTIQSAMLDSSDATEISAEYSKKLRAVQTADKEIEAEYFAKQEGLAYGIEAKKGGLQITLGGQTIFVRDKGQIEKIKQSRTGFVLEAQKLRQGLATGTITEKFFDAAFDRIAKKHVDEILDTTKFRIRPYFADKILIDRTKDDFTGSLFRFLGPKPTAPYADDYLDDIFELSNGEGSESMLFDDPNIPKNKQGLRPYQIATILKMTNTDRYAATGGLEESDGMFLAIKQGLGKTLTAIAADAVLRNKGQVGGSHVVFAPNKVVPEWVKSLVKFRGKKVITYDKKTKTFSDGQIAVISSDDRAERTALLEHIAQLENPPEFIVVGASKAAIQKTKEEKQDTDQIEELEGEDQQIEEQDNIEYRADLGFDLDFLMKQFAEKGKIGLVTVDESSYYNNRNAARTQAMQSFIETVTSEFVPQRGEDGKILKDEQGQVIIRPKTEEERRAIVWTLNGNIASNSASDTIQEFSLVNGYVRANYDAMIEQYTEPAKRAPSQEKGPKKKPPRMRIWKKGARDLVDELSGGAKEFFTRMGSSLQKLTYQNTHGAENTVVFRQTIPTGREFSNVYYAGERLLERISKVEEDANKEKGGDEEQEENARNLLGYKLAVIGIMLSASNNTANPRALIEYNIEQPLYKTMGQFLSQDELAEFSQQISKYREKFCYGEPRLGTDDGGAAFLPKTFRKVKLKTGDIVEEGYSLSERNAGFQSIISKKYRDLMEEILQSGGQTIAYQGQTSGPSWSNPSVNFMIDTTDRFREEEAKSLKTPLRVGMQGGNSRLIMATRRAIDASGFFATRLLRGGMKDAEVREMLDAHNDLTDTKPIFSFVTSAGKHGVNLQSPLAFVLANYNPSSTSQGWARFARDPSLRVIVHELGASGIGQILRDISGQKELLAVAEDIDFSNSDQVEGWLNQLHSAGVDTNKLIKKLKQARYKLLVEE